MAKIAGCRAIGSAGSSEKVVWALELGFDAAFVVAEPCAVLFSSMIEIVEADLGVERRRFDDQRMRKVQLPMMIVAMIVIVVILCGSRSSGKCDDSGQ